MATAYDVAKAAGVSIGTVSRYLTGNGYVGQASREKIAAAVAELGYIQNRAAASLRTKKTGLLGFIVSDLRNPFTAEVSAGISKEAKKHGYGVVLADSMGDPDASIEAVELLLSHDVDGIVITPPESASLNDTLVKISRRVPVVGIGLRTQPLVTDLVTVDTMGGAFTAVEYLIGLGHKAIAYVGSSTMASGRFEGYTKALNANGLHVDDTLVQVGAMNREFGYQAATNLLRGDNPPTALFAANDAIALGVLQAAAHESVSVPEQLSVIGFDDVDMAVHSTPPLTTVSQPMNEIGAAAVQILHRRLSGTKAKKRHEEIQLPTTLIVRESCSSPV